MLASLDVYRPAAQEQLKLLAENNGIQNLPIIKFNSNFERFYKLSRGGAIQDNFFYDKVRRRVFLF